MKLLLILFFTLALNLTATQKIEATVEILTITGVKYGSSRIAVNI